jgi:hypothetical protein
VVACGAIAQPIEQLAARTGLPIDVHPLPPLLHNRPDQIAGAVEGELIRLRPRYRRLAVAYADCGTYGALDGVCTRLGVARLRGAHCYDVFAGADRIATLLAEEPGTYLLTDYLVRSFRRSVVVELGLDRYPELRADYFAHYRRVVWLAQEPTPALRAAASDAAAVLGLPLERIDVGAAGLAVSLAELVAVTRAHGTAPFPAAHLPGVPFPTGAVSAVTTDPFAGHSCPPAPPQNGIASSEDLAVDAPFAFSPCHCPHVPQ